MIDAPNERRPWSDEQKAELMAHMERADVEGLDREPIYIGLAERWDRTPKAVEVKYKLLAKQRRERLRSDSPDENELQITAVLNRLENMVRSEDTYKDKYLKLKQDHDKLLKRIGKLARLLDGGEETGRDIE